VSDIAGKIDDFIFPGYLGFTAAASVRMELAATPEHDLPLTDQQAIFLPGKARRALLKTEHPHNYPALG
jgi:hypothetical protein